MGGYITCWTVSYTHLERESARSGRKVTQREFVLSLIEEALEQAEEEAAEKEATQEKCGEDA